LQPTEVTLASGRKYEFAYDDLGDLRSVTTPSMSRHHFHSVTLFGLRRLIYRPPATASVYLQAWILFNFAKYFMNLNHTVVLILVFASVSLAAASTLADNLAIKNISNNFTFIKICN